MEIFTVSVQVCGVDEAGRGSMLGPLVIAGVSLERSKIKKLSSMGVKDSKKLNSAARERLYKKIIDFVDDYYITRVSPTIIDRNVAKHQLNSLEAQYMAKVISKLDAKVSYVDSCDVNPKRFGKKVSSLSNDVRVKSYHHADNKFVIVSAASILAKVSRDRAITRLQRKHDLGSGYPSDPKTKIFVKNWFNTNKNFPAFVRKSWKPVKKLLSKQ